MKTRIILVVTLLATILMSCDNKVKKKKAGFTYENQETTIKKEDKKELESLPASKLVDLTNKGIGPIKSITLENKIDKKMVEQGTDAFKKLCAACHRVDKKFIGPSVKGITERRSPEWIMNMILNPVEMTQEDPLAKALLAEYNGVLMPNQKLTEDDSRALLEYFRTLK